MNISVATGYDVTLKAVAPVRVASVRGLVPSVDQLDETFDRLFGILEEYVERNGRRTGPSMAIYHDEGTGSRLLNMIVELAIPFEGAVTPDKEVRVYTLQGVDEMACTIHKGRFEEIGNAYRAIFTWVGEKGYRVAGPKRDTYLSCGAEDSPDYVTEVQFPVAK